VFKVDPTNDRTGNLPPLPGIYPDYTAPMVRNGSGGHKLAMAFRGTPSWTDAFSGAANRSVDGLIFPGGK
jgi:hypothetical protein